MMYVCLMIYNVFVNRMERRVASSVNYYAIFD